MDLPEQPVRPRRYFPPVQFTTRFPALDGIRAFALVMVFVVHYGGGAHGGMVGNIFNSIRLHERGGMDLFMVLSGFLITGILYDTRLDSHYFKRFYARRTLRIFPAFYAVALVVLALTPIFQYQWRWEQLTLLIYLGNFHASFDQSLYQVPSRLYPHASMYLGHLWSLCVEEQFYWIWPFVVWKVGDRVRLLRVTAWISAGALALRIIVVTMTPLRHQWEWIEHTLPFRADDLLIGGVLAMLLRGPDADWWQRRCKWILLVAGVMSVGIFAVWPDPLSPENQTVGTTLTALACAGLLGCALREGSAAYKVFNAWPIRRLGRYTYCFYIVHLLWARAWAMFLIYLTQKVHSSLLAGAISLTLNFTLTLAVSKVSYDFLEVKFLRLKKHFAYDAETLKHKHAYRAA